MEKRPAPDADEPGDRAGTGSAPGTNASATSAAAAAAAARRRIPPSVEALIPDASLFTRLIEREHQLDSLLLRKRHDLLENKTPNARQILRLTITNTCKGQPWQVLSDRTAADDMATFGDLGDDMEYKQATWCLRIEGRVLDASTQQPVNTTRMTECLQALVVHLDRPSHLHPEGNYVEWQRPKPMDNHTDVIEIERTGTDNVAVTILPTPTTLLDTYALDADLQDIVMAPEATRPQIVMAIWQYVKFHRLQDVEEKRLIHCDARLSRIFGSSRIFFPTLPDLINRHLSPPPRPEIAFTIRVDADAASNKVVVDIPVQADSSPMRERVQEVLASTTPASSAPAIATIDAELAQHLSALRAAKSKRDFLVALNREPVPTLRSWLAGQSRDLETMLAENASGMDPETQAHAEYYAQDWVRESVLHYLSAQTAQQADHPQQNQQQQPQPQQQPVRR